MGKRNTKPRKAPISHSNHHDNPNRVIKRHAVQRRQHSQPSRRTVKADSSGLRGNASSGKTHTTQSQLREKHNGKIPFTKHDHVLLIGEGDFSFAQSLVEHHKIKSVVATCFDTPEILFGKYPEAKERIASLSGVRAQSSAGSHATAGDSDGDEWNGFPPSPVGNDDDIGGRQAQQIETRANVSILYGIDATKLASGHKKAFKQLKPFSKIVFNFPHVGGLSTDINRQVRSNQQLLVGFFNAAKSLLATPNNPARSNQPAHDHDTYATSEEDTDNEHTDSALSAGYLLVTLFEGEPYTLWNIRDLARHCGLKVVESFKFPWEAYPGYKHARTLGDITKGKERSEEGQRKRAWRGEEREARCYVLTLKDAQGPYPTAGSGKRQQVNDDSD